MKSAYCIAITACLTVIWLYEEKKKRGMAGNLCWKAAVGHFHAFPYPSYPLPRK